MKYFKNTSWLFVEKIVRIVVGLFLTVWIARYLGSEKFGLFSYAQSFAGLFTIIATLGLNGIVIRELIKDKIKTQELIATTFYLKLIGALIVLIMLVIAINFTSNDFYTNSLIFIIASATIFQSFNVVDFYFQSKVLSKYVVYANFISFFISSLVKILLILQEAPLEAFAWVILWDSIILAFGFVYFFKSYTTFKIEEFKFNKTIALSLLKDSWPLILSAIAISIYMKIDQVMIKEMLNSKEVGLYAVATKLSEGFYFIGIIITNSIFPAIVNAKKRDNEIYIKRLKILYFFMWWVSIFIAIIVTFFSDFLIESLFTSEYIKSSSILVIHIWALVFVFLGLSSTKWMISENLQIYSTINTTIGAIINIVLNYYLIDYMGIEGAAWATLISYFFASYFCLLFWKKTRVNFINISLSLFLPFDYLRQNFLLGIRK